MAGDWIKMRESLHEDPAVLAMAERLETRAEHIVGYCHKFWSWVSRNSHDGSVTNVTLESVECVLNLPGFVQLMRDVGWLMYTVDAHGKPLMRIPKFDRHLSGSAKKRALNAERKHKERSKKTSRSKRDKSATREEKRREDINTPIVPLAGDASFDAFWAVVHLKVGRGAAERAYAKAVKNLAARESDPHAFLRSRMAAFAASPSAAPTDRSPIHPTTWLNQARYDDDPKAWERGGSSAQSPRRGPELDPVKANANWTAGG